MNTDYVRDAEGRLLCNVCWQPTIRINCVHSQQYKYWRVCDSCFKLERVREEVLLWGKGPQKELKWSAATAKFLRKLRRLSAHSASGT